ncbi:ADF-H domain-containing protein [Plasmodiophora brassicae]
MSITINASIAAAYKDVVDDKTPTNWLLVGYNSANPRELVEVGRGTGGYDEFISKLADDIVFGVFRCFGVDHRGSVESRRAKFVFVSYLPGAAPPMQRAKTGGHRTELKKVISNTHIEFQIEKPGEMTKDDIVKKLRQSGGAHQPSDYEF